MPTDNEIKAALAAWHKDWTEGPPEQDEVSAMRAALTAAEQVRAKPVNASDVDPTAGLDPDFNWGGDP